MTDVEYSFAERPRETPPPAVDNPLPRSVTRSGEFQLLDGEWRFELDPDDRGLRERWQEGHAYEGRTHWPGSIEAQLAAADQSGHRDDEVVGWYERDFSIPAEWLAEPEREVQVTFGACGYETRVWLNGAALRTVEGEAVHRGEYTSFSYELPRELLRDVNRLTARVADSLDPERPRGKQESRVYKRGGIWYQTISGPVRSIWIEPVSRNRLRSRFTVISTVEDRLAEFLVTARVRDPGEYRLRISVHLSLDTPPLAVSELGLPLEVGERRQRLTLELPGTRPWSTADPALYHVVAELVSPAGRTSRIQTRFGLRRIEARGRSVYLNGERIYLDGILYQPATCGYDDIRRHLHAIRALGCNLARVHIAGIDPRVYDLADELGLLLWVEVPSPHASTRRSREQHWAELQRMLAHIGSHPSVVIVSLYNEDWGAEDIETNAETRAYIARTWAHLRVHDPQWLVVDNDGWRHVSTEGRLESHLLTAHVYQTELERWREVLDRLVAGEVEGVTAQRLVVGDPFRYAGQVPLVISEWGGFGFEGYGGPKESDERAARIRRFKRDLRRRPIAGDVYTQATSVEEETNGLIDAETGELLVPRGILGPERVRPERDAVG